MVKQWNFGWGNPYFLLEILDNMYAVSAFSMGGTVQDMIYGPYEGSPKIIEETHRVIKEVMGLKYSHILMTNGASNAINIVLRHFKSRGGVDVYTTKYGYPSYEEMIKRAGLNRIRHLNSPIDLGTDSNSFLRLIDSPENPFGEQFGGGDASKDVWDSVYHSRIYTNNLHIYPSHRIHIGSYSKLLGIAGARVGYIAVNDPILYEALLAESINDLTGPSKPSHKFVLDILKKIDLDLFTSLGHEYLCYNKEEFQKIEYLFGGQMVNETGMFYCVKVDNQAMLLLDSVGVEYVKLDHETIRLSMGQTKQIVKDGIRAILKGDGK